MQVAWFKNHLFLRVFLTLKFIVNLRALTKKKVKKKGGSHVQVEGLKSLVFLRVFLTLKFIVNLRALNHKIDKKQCFTRE